MAAKIELALELKSLNKSSKKTLAGIEQVTYNCQFKGSSGSVMASLSMKASDLRDLEQIVSQRMGKVILIEIKDLNPEVDQE